MSKTKAVRSRRARRAHELEPHEYKPTSPPPMYQPAKINYTSFTQTWSTNRRGKAQTKTDDD